MKCIVKDCQNHEHEGKFIGSLCSPCYRYITEGEGKYSQAFRNAQRQWVGLTEQEHTQIAVEAGCMSADWVFYGALVERKVKEKNT